MTNEFSSHLGIRDWYRLSKGGTRAVFFRDLPTLDCDALMGALASETSLPSTGRLRTKVELEELSRSLVPPIQDLAMRGPNEQTLQWMFMHRKRLLSLTECVLARELPTCCAGESVEGRADLLAFDQLLAQPIIVELKCEKASDPLSGVVLEVLSHWAFNVRHLADFNAQLSGFGYLPSKPPRLAIAAPEGYYVETRRRTARRQCNEYDIAMTWIDALLRNNIVTVDLYAIEDDWLSAGPDFQMWKI